MISIESGSTRSSAAASAVALAEVTQDAPVGALLGGRVPVHARDPRVRKEGEDLLLYLLRADSERLHFRPAAVRACHRGPPGILAVVALQRPLVDMVGQRDRAVRALRRPAAVPAEHELRVAPAVQEKDGLLLARQP